jgi:electron transfer flavoprotein beta subunit
MVGERLGIVDQFQGVDSLSPRDDGSFEILERIEGGRHQVSVCAGPPALVGWATGSLAEPRNNPQVGMANMRTIMPALQKARAANLQGSPPQFLSVTLPRQQRSTKVVKDLSTDEIARQIAAWINGD